MKVEYDLAKVPVTYEQEKQLGEDSVRLDFLIIKKNSSIVLYDPIGEFFRMVNLFEYKSPEDGLSIDDFYKAQGYCLIYKGFDRKVNELPIEEITLTLVRHSYPKNLISCLNSSGFIIHFDGKISIPVQLVVSSRLPDGEYAGLKLLSKGTTLTELRQYAEKAVLSNDDNVKTNAGTVINVCLDINKNLGKKLKEDKTMNEIIKDIFKADFDAVEQKTNERVATDMLREKLPLSLITRISKIPESTIRTLAKNIDVAIL